MPPQEDTSLLTKNSTDEDNVVLPSEIQTERNTKKCVLFVLAIIVAMIVALSMVLKANTRGPPSGEYKLVQRQKGHDFFNYYTFLDGPDSLGSAGHNVYVGKKRSFELGIANVTKDPVTGKDHVFIKSAKTADGAPRESVRLEGNRRFNDGLFIFDLSHMPAGCGVWPAVWLTDEDKWPDNGEVDIVEGINRQPMVKTALHTSDQCSMYAHVPRWAWSGDWDTATGLPDTFTGEPNLINRVEADNCWVMAAHQWANQGCVAVDKRNNTLGAHLNEAGGGIYALEWDPANHFIRSFAFPREDGIPQNLQDVIDTASHKDPSKRVTPNTTDWGLPYAYFAIGDTTGCSADHFKNMRIVINLAFCGTVAGNRFSRDCPDLADFPVEDEEDEGDPWKTCVSYINSNPKELTEAYWEIRGAYVYQRSY
eukprot:CAMPEP_0168720936 /NCGR_PEP_ID=MMETSP0724-20121128/1824_1 /TAXON_ID=265536 /ORGANISM="Amphiprora sp., Strain CCMP467" /LENGTH=422 /DNA_ID=CAMNT_0008767563 /DNA_START=38 /DNA_END=1306 /DNA_ORIENTATION=+